MVGGNAVSRNCIERILQLERRICFFFLEPDLVQTVAADAASEMGVELRVGKR